MSATILRLPANVRACGVRPAAWWDLGHPRNATAIHLCGGCPFRTSCAPVAGRPKNQIIGGVPYSRNGRPLATCDTCGHPLTTGSYRDTGQRCDTCRDRAVAVHHDLIVARRRERRSYAAIGNELGLTPDSIRHYLNRHQEVAA